MTARFEKLAPVQWAMRHPRLAAWLVLSLGMVVLLLNAARDVGLLPTQWLALIVAAILVAGACVWIISWEDEDEEAANPDETNATGDNTASDS
jgi:hypothetical protein